MYPEHLIRNLIFIFITKTSSSSRLLLLPVWMPQLRLRERLELCSIVWWLVMWRAVIFVLHGKRHRLELDQQLVKRMELGLDPLEPWK